MIYIQILFIILLLFIIISLLQKEKEKFRIRGESRLGKGPYGNPIYPGGRGRYQPYNYGIRSLYTIPTYGGYGYPPITSYYPYSGYPYSGYPYFTTWVPGSHRGCPLRDGCQVAYPRFY